MKDSKSASNHSDIQGNNFNKHEKFILIDQLNQTNLDKLTLPKRLKIRENFLILRLESLHPIGFTRELNKT